MRQHAGDLVGVFRFRQQAVEQKYLAARQRKGVGNRRRQHGGLHGGIKPRLLAQRIDQLGKGLLAGRVAADLAVEQSFTCFSATSPSRRSSASGTSGARRSAASGTPNRTIRTIEAVAASDQPTIFATPRRPR